MAVSRERRASVDVARVIALALVVAGHLAMAVIDRGPSGGLRGTNVFELHPEWSWVTVISPMPVFFVAAGFANAASDPLAAAGRLRTLVGLAAAVIGTWSLAVVVSEPFVGRGSVVGDGARLATQPLWFIAAYAPLLAISAAAPRAVMSRPLTVAVGCTVLVGACDLARFVAGAPSWVGWPGFLAAWAVPWTIGGWWRGLGASDPGLSRRREVSGGSILFAGGSVLAVLLVRHGGYSASMLDVVEGARSNSTPPTLYTTAVAVAQGGVVLAAAGALDRVGNRWRALWSRAGVASLGVYAWHLTALALCSAFVAAGLPAPERFTVSWWLSRPLWWGAIIALTMAFVGITARVLSGQSPDDRPHRRRRRQHGDRVTGDGAGNPSADVERSSWWRIAGGTALGALTAAAVGLHGPSSSVWAVGLSVGMGISWGLLRPGRPAPRRLYART